MFRRTSEALALSEASLLVLRPALNAPVLNVEFLPVGPARAALVAFAEEYGGIGIALGIRSNEGGQVAVFRNQAPIDETASLVAVLEPAIAAGERMGFLFDEDMLEGSGSNGRSQATALWGRLMGELEIPSPARVVPKEPAATEPILDLDEPLPGEDTSASIPELEIDEDMAAQSGPEITLELDAAPPVSEVPARRETTQPTEPIVPAPAEARKASAASKASKQLAKKPAKKASPPEPPPPVLSKFRHAAEDSATQSRERRAVKREAEPASDAPSELGRIPIVRVRRGRDRVKRIPYLARLLSSF